MTAWLRANERWALALGWTAFAAAWIALASTATGPGMLYDEAWLAQQGRAFVEPLREGLMPPGTQKTWLFGRPFPLFALPYLGSLKSQLLIGPIALLGNDAATARLATLAIGLAALLATMAAARRAFDVRVALLAGLLLALDPTVFFHAQWEWGPFTTGWLCRALGAALLLRGHAERQRGATWAGGFVLGLGIYNRADFALIGAAMALGLALFHGPALRDLFRQRRSELIVAAGLFLLGALPMLLNAGRVLGTFGELAARGDLAERVQVLASTLSGSYAHRLMAAGGRYDALPAMEAPLALLGLAAVAAVVVCGVELARRGAAELRDGRGALAVAVVALAFAMLSLRGATRAHHMLNLAPFAHVLVAAVLVHALDRSGWQRGLAAAAALAVVASEAHALASTRALIERTGGRGWWSEEIHAVARALEAEPGSIAVSLDWGFHLQLLFLTSQPRLLEPTWQIGDHLRQHGRWQYAASGRELYLVHDAPYDRFGFGPPALASARALADRAQVLAHRDREGEPAFYSIRIREPHVLRIDPGGVHFDLARR